MTFGKNAFRASGERAFRGPASSRDWIRANLAPTAALAEIAEIKLVEEGEKPFKHLGLAGDKTGLKVSFVDGFGSHAGTGQVGRAKVGFRAVDENAFHVISRAENSLETLGFDEFGKSIEILTKSWPRFLGVNQSDVDTSQHAFGKDLEKGVESPGGHFNVHILQVGRRNPDEPLCRWEELLNHAMIDLLVEKQLEHRELEKKEAAILRTRLLEAIFTNRAYPSFREEERSDIQRTSTLFGEGTFKRRLPV